MLETESSIGVGKMVESSDVQICLLRFLSLREKNSGMEVNSPALFIIPSNNGTEALSQQD
jgi:hypothetical protein